MTEPGRKAKEWAEKYFTDGVDQWPTLGHAIQAACDEAIALEREGTKQALQHIADDTAPLVDAAKAVIDDPEHPLKLAVLADRIEPFCGSKYD